MFKRIHASLPDVAQYFKEACASINSKWRPFEPSVSTIPPSVKSRLLTHLTAESLPIVTACANCTPEALFSTTLSHVRILSTGLIVGFSDFDPSVAVLLDTKRNFSGFRVTSPSPFVHEHLINDSVQLVCETVSGKRIVIGYRGNTLSTNLLDIDLIAKNFSAQLPTLALNGRDRALAHHTPTGLYVIDLQSECGSHCIAHDTPVWIVTLGGQIRTVLAATGEFANGNSMALVRTEASIDLPAAHRAAFKPLQENKAAFPSRYHLLSFVGNEIERTVEQVFSWSENEAPNDASFSCNGRWLFFTQAGAAPEGVGDAGVNRATLFDPLELRSYELPISLSPNMPGRAVFTNDEQFLAIAYTDGDSKKLTIVCLSLRDGIQQDCSFILQENCLISDLQYCDQDLLVAIASNSSSIETRILKLSKTKSQSTEIDGSAHENTTKG